MAKSAPTKMPNETQQSTQALPGQSKPEELSPFDLVAALAASGQSTPTLEPPVASLGEEEVAVWLNDKRISMVWSISENRNVFVAVTGVGWKKLANNSDSAIVALNIMACNARQMNSSVNYREEADGMIHEMYVW